MRHTEKKFWLIQVNYTTHSSCKWVIVCTLETGLDIAKRNKTQYRTLGLISAGQYNNVVLSLICSRLQILILRLGLYQ